MLKPQDDAFVTPAMAAAIIACSEATLWRLVAAGRLARYRQHTRTFFLRDDVEKLSNERNSIRMEKT